MAALQANVVKKHLRTRPEEETEPGVFLQEDGSMSERQQVRLRSLNSTVEATIIFCNDSPLDARAVWLDFQGNEVAYSIIEPGVKKTYRTFATHPWIIRTAETGERLMLGGRMVLYAQAQEQKVSIGMPPALQWSAATHKFFPDEFRAASKALLTAHARIRTTGSSSELEEAPCTAALTKASLAAAEGWCGADCKSTLAPAYSMASDSCTTLSTLTASSCTSAGHLASMDLDDAPLTFSACGKRRNASMASYQASVFDDAAMDSGADSEMEDVSSSGSYQPPSLLYRLFGRLISRRPTGPVKSQRSSSRFAYTELPMEDAAADSAWQDMAELTPDLVVLIINAMAPVHRQCILRSPAAGPDILPALLPSDPSKWEPASVPGAAAEAAPAAAGQPNPPGLLPA